MSRYVLCSSTCFEYPTKASVMPTTKHETNRPPVKHNVEIRIRNFKNFTITALCNFTVLIVLVGIFWFWVNAIPSTAPIPFHLRWPCIMCLYLGTIARTPPWLLQAIIFIRTEHMSKIDNTNFEDWVLANFCVTVSLTTMGFVGWYWKEIIALTIRSFFYWTCTMICLCLLFWIINRTIQFYREFKGMKHQNAWGILIGVNLLRFYEKFEGVKIEGTIGLFLDFCRAPFEVLKFCLDIVGFQLGRGPLFDRLPEELKAERRRCKTPSDIKRFLDSYLAFAAGPSEEEVDIDEDAQDCKERREACFPPSSFEWEPNPVIFPHLRDDHVQAMNSGPAIAKNTPDSQSMDTDGALNVATDCDYKGITEDSQKCPSASPHTGPATMSVNLSSFACPQCTFVFKKKFELKLSDNSKHVTQTHNHRFKCVYSGCQKTFGLRTNLERHEATHTQETRFQCLNPWCRTPEKIFTREDNLKRHMKLCITSE
ncbi:Zinc finger transcription factor ace1 [Pyrenophora seminiperda CCB06]|uniref:C2H2 type master regulator of conidiophore development brlA n=1 Tax=Pyrenophora seminiperda CCB06 TaxID=1302712 RepID=A0A3M7M001_9PLEO|nr:Zinc finger transcription factor ace1 [Pyrenophora seminiperda CCB06]